jgi:urease accessory protein
MSHQRVHISCDEHSGLSSLALLRLQSWLSPTFPNGAYSYSHGLEWAVEAGFVTDRQSLVDWLGADLCHGSGRNEAIFFNEAYRCAIENDLTKLILVAEFAAASRSTFEFALESSQPASACLAMLRHVWPDPILETLSELECQPALSVVLGARMAKEKIPLCLSLATFLQGYVANLITAGVRLIPLGQTDGQLVIASLEPVVLLASENSYCATLDDLGSAGFLVELSSILHETQYTRLFRS